jgi:hypothetical protein
MRKLLKNFDQELDSGAPKS